MVHSVSISTSTKHKIFCLILFVSGWVFKSHPSNLFTYPVFTDLRDHMLTQFASIFICLLPTPSTFQLYPKPRDLPTYHLPMACKDALLVCLLQMSQWMSFLDFCLMLCRWCTAHCTLLFFSSENNESRLKMVWKHQNALSKTKY